MAIPPPYTLDQINAMTSPAERLRARAELNSYIARMKKEKEERLVHEHNHLNTTPYNRNNSTTYRGHFTSSATRRGGHSYGRGHPATYHPYSRTFTNKSVSYKKTENADEVSGTTNATILTLNSTNGEHDTKPESKTLCPAFTTTGVCTNHRCRQLHDADKLAICKRWLFKGDCPKVQSCPLSHDASAHNVPTCQHFQEGRCNNEDCRFAHIRINPSAPNCEAFGISGYCQKGSECPELHAFECPHYSNTGTCHYGDRCRLGHVHRASRMKKAKRHAPLDTASSSPESGDHGTSETDVGRDNAIDMTTRDVHQFTQQSDFVPLDASP